MAKVERPTSYYEEIKPLLTAPAVPLWQQELEKVLLGKRDHIVDRHRSIQGYVEVLWAQSSNAALAERTFRGALRKVVRDWRPSIPRSEYYFAAILELIGAYTPPSGFIRVLGHIQRWGYFGRNVTGPTTGRDLHLKALIALQNYFPTAPALAQDAPGFNPYVVMLHEMVKDPTYSGHSARRLIELELLQLSDQEVVDAIRQNVETLRELIPTLLKTSRRSRAPRDLALIYYQALATGENVDQIFAQAATAHRARFEPQMPVPIIYFENGEVIKFYFTAEEMEKHARLHDQASRVSEVATLIRETHEASKAEEFAELLEETLNKDDEEIVRFVKAVGRSGIYLAPGAAGPELYLPQGVTMPIPLRPEALQKYMLRMRFGEEPQLAVQTFVRSILAKAATN
jgi:hypothetical protein